MSTTFANAAAGTTLDQAFTQAKTSIGATRAQRRAIKQAKPVISIYKNNPDGTAGAIFVGRFNVRELPRYEFPMRKNVSSQGFLSVRASNWLAKFLGSIPNNPAECKNILVRVDMYGGQWRWTGLGHHWTAETVEGADVITFYFNDDMQHLQFMLAPPNPVLPMTVFNFPRVWPEFGPSDWCVGVLGWLNEARNELTDALASLVLPPDPFDLSLWENEVLTALEPQNWQAHWLVPSFLNSTSLWTLLASRMNTVDSVIADALEDGQLCLTYRRYFTGEGEAAPAGLWFSDIANGAIVFEVTDRSGFTLPGGTFFTTAGFGVVTGAARSVIQWTDGFVEDLLTTVTDSESLYADEYWQTDFLGTFASAPGICIRDSHWNDLQSRVTWSPDTAISVVVGGDNPTLDAIAKLLIESIGNLLGYFLLGGFDSAGTIAADVIMPFLVGTIGAWDRWTNTGRQNQLGWMKLWEVFQQGAENNAWALAALAALRGGFLATRSETSHTMVIGQNAWPIPGLHYSIGDRIMSTAGVIARMGIDILFINQVEEMTLQGAADGAFQFFNKVGQSKAGMTTGERAARLMKKAMDTMQNIGVHLVS
ncbi:hypothetical protein [Mycobacterium malmoense]|uniref:Gp37-like protein n=1 Tax=Mycobacterium malmoense TaxID=1780 RepID=UPI0009F9A356|nr:hypothetical protein [Mycobacterium malmoense]